MTKENDFIKGVRKYAKASLAIHRIKQCEIIDRMNIGSESKRILKEAILK